MSQTFTSAGKYRPDIDGIRAWAVLSVFLFHLQPTLLPGGFLGVDIFFVISGYLITGIILREHHRGVFSFSHFYARRVKRIFPALFVVLLLSSFAAILVLPPESYSNFMASARYAAAQLSNFLFSREVSYFDEGFTGQPLLHTWSLGVEEQFYLFWPPFIFACFLLFSSSGKPIDSKSIPQQDVPYQTSPVSYSFEQQVINRKIGVTFFLVSVASFFLCNILAVTNHNLAFYMFYTRALEFCIGGFIALGIIPRPATRHGNYLIGFIGILLLVYSVLFIEALYLGRSFLHFGVLIPCIGTALIIHADVSMSPINRMLGFKLPSAIGKISYSLYLYHWPVIIFYKAISRSHELSLSASLFIIFISFVLATLSYLLVEQPARKTGWGDKRILGCGLSIIVVFAILFYNLEGHSKSKWRITHYKRNPVKSPLRYSPECKKINKDGLLYFQCQPESEEPTPIVALVGDSHSPHYLRATTEWAKDNSYNVKFLGTAGCPVGSGKISIKSHLGKEHEQECDEALPVFNSEILQDDNVELVLVAHRYDLFYDGKEYGSPTRMITFKNQDGSVVNDHTAFYAQLLNDTARELKHVDKTLVILKQVPVFNNIDACNWEPLLSRLLQKDRDCSYDFDFISKWQQPSDDFIDTFAATHDVLTIDPVPAFNSPIKSGFNLYNDRDHLNNFGMLHLVPHVTQSLDTIITDPKDS